MVYPKKGRPQWKRSMVTTDLQEDERIQWLKFVLNPNSPRPQIEDWRGLLEFAQKQAIVGVCSPIRFDKFLTDKEVLLEWIGYQSIIAERNEVLNRQTVSLTEILREAGFRCCILKGQGNATMYPVSELRTPGDIDVWVDAEEEEVYQYVKKLFPEEKASYKHIHFPIFDDTSVDVHVTPLKLYSKVHQKRLQQWIVEHKEEQFEHKIRLTDTDREVSVPTARFNVVYQLGHMLIHLFDEGVGLRQVVDYYFVLTRLDVTEKERRELVDTVEDLGMLRFAKGIMWIEYEVLGLPIEKCLVEPDEKKGGQLLNDILESGNFGHYSERYNGKSGFYYRGLVESRRVMQLLPIAPLEGTAKLILLLR